MSRIHRAETHWIRIRQPTASKVFRKLSLSPRMRSSQPDRKAAQLLPRASRTPHLCRSCWNRQSREPLKCCTSPTPPRNLSASYGFSRFSKLLEAATFFDTPPTIAWCAKSARSTHGIFIHGIPLLDIFARNKRYRAGSHRRHCRVQRALSFCLSGRTSSGQLRARAAAGHESVEKEAQEEEQPTVASVTGSYFDALPEDDEVLVSLDFFSRKPNRHLQIVSDCLLSLEARRQPCVINKLFPDSHRKGSAAQVGLQTTWVDRASRRRSYGPFARR